MSVSSKIEAVIAKLQSICEHHKPQISYIFYFPWKDKQAWKCGIRKPSKQFSLIAHIIRSEGKLVDATIAHIAKYGDGSEVMDIEQVYLADYSKIFASVQEVIVAHCDTCREKWKVHVLSEGIGVEPDIESSNDYVREVVALRAAVEKAQFCESVDEHFPHRDELIEYGSEYTTRAEEIFHVFEFLGEVSYYFAMEYWERQEEKMTIWRSSNGNDLPGVEYLNDK